LNNNLIVLAKAGDKDAIIELYKKAWRKVYPLLKYKFPESICMDDIEDVFHDIMVKFLENPLAIKAQTDRQFFKWVLVCCNNKILDIIKSQYNKSKTPLTTVDEEGKETEFEIEDPYNLEEDFIENEINEHILTKIKKLNEIDRKIIMSLYNGYSLREISEQLGISYDNIRQRKRRAIKKLSANWTDIFKED
jgi:RNA polymerase sigma factor (sigma-70 family)